MIYVLNLWILYICKCRAVKVIIIMNPGTYGQWFAGVVENKQAWKFANPVSEFHSLCVFKNQSNQIYIYKINIIVSGKRQSHWASNTSFTDL